MSWQPIETAPKDGSRVLAVWEHGWEPQFVRWFLNPRSGIEGWNDENELDCEFHEWPPTHWMPLPPVHSEMPLPPVDVGGILPKGL